MTTRRVLSAILAVVAVACSDPGDENKTPTEAVATGPTEPNGSGTGGGTIPTFNLDGGAGQPPPKDPPVFDFDAAAAQAAPLLEPDQRAIWAVDDKKHLVRILVDDPSTVVDVGLVDFPPTEQVIGIDFRPSNGLLYAMTTPASRLYTIDLKTAKVKAIGGETSPRVMGQAYGFDFNPVLDLLRVQSDVDQNLRIHPATGAVVGTDKALHFGVDDPNFGQSPNIVGTAYTNSAAGAGETTTTLFAIDSTRNILTKIAPPNEGTVVTIGALGVDIVANAGFDIHGSEDSALEAYAALRVEGSEGTGLYKIDLDGGGATLVGKIAHPAALRGIAIEP